jgi:hypothetical protein
MPDSPKMRDIGGIKAPAYGTSEKLIKEADRPSTGSKPMDGPDGGMSKPRLDRPGRKAGGRTGKGC